MKIKFNHVRAINFEELDDGQLFRTADDLDCIYIKMEPIYTNDDGNPFNAVNLSNGTPSSIADWTDVFPFEATLVEQYRER